MYHMFVVLWPAAHIRFYNISITSFKVATFQVTFYTEAYVTTFFCELTDTISMLNTCT